MIRRFVGVLLCVGLLCGNLFGAEVPALTGRLVDRAQALSAQQAEAIEAALSAFERSTGGQLAILIEKHIPKDETLEGWTLKVAETWQLGHKDKDNGALLYLAMNDRRNRLEVGYGWESVLTDARAGDVLRSMTPALRAGDTSAALITAMQQMHRIIVGKPLADLPGNPSNAKRIIPAPKSKTRSEVVQFIIGIILILLFVRYPWMLLLLLSATNSRHHSSHHNRFGGSGRGDGGFGGGGFSGGGGSFGGGGASGRW